MCLETLVVNLQDPDDFHGNPNAVDLFHFVHITIDGLKAMAD
jgi:hypothetical protein